MISEQLTIEGQIDYSAPDGIMKVTRRVMREKPVTYKSHRLLMIEIAKEWGLRWDELEKQQRYVLERLFDTSPDIERCARKVREEQAMLTKSSSSLPIQNKLNPEDNPSYDPFAAVEQEIKVQERQRRYWKR